MKSTPSLFAYGSFGNVRLTPEQLGMLNERFGEDETRRKIEVFSAGKAAHGYVYKNDYAAMIVWDRLESERQAKKKGAIPPVARPRGKEYSTARCVFCSTPHEWKCQSYFDVGIRELACPAVITQMRRPRGESNATA